MSYAELDPKAAETKLSEFRIIDVRQPHEFGGPLGHIDGAEPLPLGTLTAHPDSLEGSRPLLLVCRSGVRSGKACEVLQNHGIDDVTNLVGGMIAWNRASLPIERTKAESLEALLDSLAAWLAQVAGKTVEDAMSSIDRMLQEEGASLDAPPRAAMDRALDSLASDLEASSPPPDLDLTLSVFRSDLSLLFRDRGQ